MERSHRRRALLATALVGLLLLSPLPEIQSVQSLATEGWLDKGVHAFLFAALGWLWTAALGRSRVGGASWWLVVPGLTAYGGLLEGLQQASGWRTFDWLDLGANLVGALAAWIAASALRHRHPAATDPR